jgi:hypothetical protein
MGYLKEDTDINCECCLDETAVVDNSRFERFGDIMVDLETLGTRQDAIVLEISAVEFNHHTGEIGEVFDAKLDIDDQLLYRRSLNCETLQWWFKQDKDARKNVFDDIIKFPTHTALCEFGNFVERCDNKCNCDSDRRVVKLWGNGSIFDLGILQNMYETCIHEVKLPWKFWAVNDVRTIVDINPDVKKNCKFDGTPHCAVDDCKHEIKYLVETLKTIKVIRPEDEIKKEKDNSPRYIDIILSDAEYLRDGDLEDFPINDFLSKDQKDTIKLTIDLKKKKLLGWKNGQDKYSLFAKVVDSGTYIVRNSDGDILYRRDGYVPNNVVPPHDGYGDYIGFTIDEDGSLPDWYNYDELDFTDFENDD